MPTEGQIAVNRATGQRAVYRGGQWVAMPAAQQPPTDPTFPYQGAQAQAQVQGQNLDNQGQAISNRVAAATADADVQKARADAEKARADAERAALEIEQARMNMVQGKDPEAAVRAAKSILRLLDDKGGIQEQFDNNLSGTSILEYLPTEDMRSFDANAGFLKPAAKKLFRAKGEGSQSDAEGRDYNALVPNTWNTDATNAALIANLRAEAIATLDEYGVQVPEYDPADPQQRANALTYLRTDGGRTQGIEAAQGNTRAVPYPDEGQAEHDALVASLIAANGGRLDPQAYARARAQLDQKYGMQGDPASYASWAAGINEYLDNGGATIPTGIEAGQEEMGLVDQARNSLVNNSGGAALAGYLNSAALGAPEALTGGNMDALRDEYGLATLGGEIGGALTGTAGLGMAGRAGLRAMGRQGIQSQFGRNLATDVAYGGAYGGVTEGDPVTGAVLGGVGSTLGQGVGKVAGDAIGGVRLGEAAQRLRDRGINLTTGRILGDTASAIEDKMVSLPFVGDMVRRRQGEGFRQFNEAAFREGGAPIGFAPSEVGEEGIGQFRQAVGNAYDSATAGQQVPFDQQFMTDMGGVYNNALRMPKDRQRELGSIIEARIAPITDTGQMTGEQYQQAMRALKQNRSKVPGRFEGFEQEYRDAVSGTMDALDGAMRRGGGDSVIEGLNSANAANKNLKILENASLDKAKIGTQTGEAEVFLPSQLIGAARQSEKKYGASSLKQLGKDGQAVLPSTVPNSGTADRLAMGGLILGGGGATGGFSAENPLEGGAAGLGGAAATMAALTALGSRRGQKALETILLDRPDALRQFGESVRRRKGLFGSAAVPIALTAQ